MTGLLFVLLIVLPIIEIYLFIEIGGALGAGWTILLIFATALFGARAMRRQGLAVLAEAQAAQAAGRPPVAAAAHGVLILLGGILLLLPGFFTDLLGAFLLIGFIRAIVLEALLGLVLPLMGAGVLRPHQHETQGQTRRQNDGPQIIEGEYRVDDEGRDK